MKTYRTLNSFVAFVAAVALMFQGMIPVARAAEKSSKPSIDVTKVRVPEVYGTIKEVRKGGDKVIFYLQDAHCNLEAQQNNAKILEDLINQFGIDTVGTEGDTGPIDVSHLAAFPNKEAMADAATYFLNQGRISGPTFLAITGDKRFSLVGLEEQPLDDQNMESFKQFVPDQKRSVDEMAKLRAWIGSVADKVYSPEQKAFADKVASYRAGKIKFTEYAQALRDAASKNGVDISAHKNFELQGKTFDMEGKINFDAVETERAAVVDELSKKISKDEASNLVVQSLSFRLGRLGAVEYYDILKGLCDKAGVALKAKANLAQYTDYIKAFDQINKDALVDESEAIAVAVKDKMFATDDQRNLDKMTQHMDLLGKMFEIKLGIREYPWYKKAAADNSVKAVVDAVNAMASKNGVAAVGVDVDALANGQSKVEKFYDTSVERDAILAKNAIALMKDKDRAAIVTGGFHTKSVADRLAKEGFSLVIITPRITDFDVKSPYVDVMMGKPTPIEAIFAGKNVKTATRGTRQGPEVAPGGPVEQLAQFNDAIEKAGRLPDAQKGPALDEIKARLEGLTGLDDASKGQVADLIAKITDLKGPGRSSAKIIGRPIAAADRDALIAAEKAAIDSLTAHPEVLVTGEIATMFPELGVLGLGRDVEVIVVDRPGDTDGRFVMGDMAANADVVQVKDPTSGVYSYYVDRPGDANGKYYVAIAKSALVGARTDAAMKVRLGRALGKDVPKAKALKNHASEDAANIKGLVHGYDLTEMSYHLNSPAGIKDLIDMASAKATQDRKDKADALATAGEITEAERVANDALTDMVRLRAVSLLVKAVQDGTTTIADLARAYDPTDTEHQNVVTDVQNLVGISAELVGTGKPHVGFDISTGKVRFPDEPDAADPKLTKSQDLSPESKDALAKYVAPNTSIKGHTFKGADDSDRKAMVQHMLRMAEVGASTEQLKAFALAHMGGVDGFVINVRDLADYVATADGNDVQVNNMTLSANVRAYVAAMIATGKPVVFYGTDLTEQGLQNFMQGVVGVSAEEFTKPSVGLVSTKGVAVADTGTTVYTPLEKMFKTQKITPAKILWAARQGDGAISMNGRNHIKVVEAVGNVAFDAVLAMLETDTTQTQAVADAKIGLIQHGYSEAEAAAMVSSTGVAATGGPIGPTPSAEQSMGEERPAPEKTEAGKSWA